MGVTLDLRLIDHERLVVRGLQAVNDAIRHGDPEILRKYLTGLPVDVDSSIVDYHRQRLSKLRDVKAPEMIIRNEEQFLRLASGAAYRPAEFQNSTLEELRQLLGTWCWVTHSYSLDKAWEELHWFLEPMAGPDDFPLHPLRLNVGDPNLTVFTKALHGEAQYPKNDLGDPVIRTLGSSAPDCSGYNPPETSAVILEALERVELASWDDHVPFRCELYRRACGDLNNEELTFVEEELSCARDGFAVLVAAYSKAVKKGYGMSCEYSL
jgi:hypothetical protein